MGEWGCPRPAAVVESYKNLGNIECDFRIIKTDDLGLRLIHHRLNERAKAHVLICMLACYLVWHLRKAWVPMTFTDEHRTQRDKPVGLTVWTCWLRRIRRSPWPTH